ncbi:hypothetical protein F4779DRAFT_601364 [Xylariaceae sp. FL0662B]|nr:hypothetical protein F4779DRAFT_601364 [Xylariaceae sp. FL0662B]
MICVRIMYIYRILLLVLTKYAVRFIIPRLVLIVFPLSFLSPKLCQAFRPLLFWQFSLSTRSTIGHVLDYGSTPLGGGTGDLFMYRLYDLALITYHLH